MEQPGTPMTLPAHVTGSQRRTLTELIERNVADHGSDLRGVVLSGSAGRDMATDRSDLDVYVVLADDAAADRRTTRSAAVDEIPIGMGELEAVAAPGAEGYWQRWSFAWVPVVLDRSGGRLVAALHRQATLTRSEQTALLVQHDRLDGWLNLAYRSLKNHSDGRAFEARLDAAESLPRLLDIIFTLNARVRPYNTYLPWELRRHPMPGWPAESTLALCGAVLAGRPDAIRSAFARIERACHRFDAEHGDGVLDGIIRGWGKELGVLRGG